jgi:tRNA(fMet)-specific endonuclease VapC
MGWLLDTNAWIDYLRNPASLVRVQLVQRQPEEIFSCSIVRAELMHGALKYGAPERRQAIIQSALAPFASYAFDDEAAQKYATIRHELERWGQRIGPHDSMIAAICVTHQCVLVTANESQFERVPSLRIVNWQIN